MKEIKKKDVEERCLGRHHPDSSRENISTSMEMEPGEATLEFACLLVPLCSFLAIVNGLASGSWKVFWLCLITFNIIACVCLLIDRYCDCRGYEGM